MIVWNDFLSDARVLREAKTLAAAGHKVFVHALHVPGLTPRRERVSERIEVIRVPTGASPRRPGRHVVRPLSGGPFRGVVFAGQMTTRLLARSFAHLRMLVSMVRHRPDVVHAHDVNTLPTAFAAARLARARLVYDAHEISTAREGYEGLKSFVAHMERALMPRADATITTTDLRARYFQRGYGVPRPVVLQNRPVRAAIGESGLIRQRLSLVRGRPIVLYQGGLQPGRGLELLVRAAARIPEAEFVLIGRGVLEAPLKELAAKEGVTDRVHFVPAVPLAELPTYTASADIGVQLLQNTCFNHYSTDSNKLFEYVQGGLALVASDFPEIRRIVAGHEVGLLVPSGDPPAIINALHRLVTDADLRERFRSHARIAADKLTWESQESKLLDIYRALDGCASAGEPR